MRDRISSIALAVFVRAKISAEGNQGVILFLCGMSLLLFGLHDAVYAASGAGAGYSGKRFDQICQAVLALLEGEFGALLAAIAGMGAIIASAMGGFKMAWSLLVVSVGCFILREYKDMWFNECGGGNR